MADFRALIFKNGANTQIRQGDGLSVGGYITSDPAVATDLEIRSSGTEIRLQSGKSLVSLGGAADIDFSASSGVFKTPSGAVDIGPGNVTISGAASLTAAGIALDVTNNVLIGGTVGITGKIYANGDISRSVVGNLTIGGDANTNTLFLGRVGQLVNILGDIQIDGVETVVGDSTFQANATFEGDVTFGNANTDNVRFRSNVGDATYPDIVFQKELAHSIYVAGSTTADTAGGALSLASGAGVGTGGGGALSLAGGAGGVTSGASPGGALSLLGGAAGVGSDSNGGSVTIDGGALDGAGSGGSVNIGTTNANSVSIGYAGMSNASLIASTIDIGASGADKVNLTAQVNTSITFSNAADRTISIANGPNGHILTLISGAGTLPGVAGGNLELKSAAGSSSIAGVGGAGGAIQILAGNGASGGIGQDGGIGGDILIAAGQSASTQGSITAAAAILRGGNAGSAALFSSQGGEGSLRGGQGGAFGAAGTAGRGGYATVLGGKGGTTTGGTPGIGGNVYVTGGEGGLGGNGVGGDVILDGGLATGAAAEGVISLGVNAGSQIKLGRAGCDTVVQAGATLSTTGSGNINLPNNGSAKFQIEGVAVGATVTAANLDTLTDGSNADALHVHAASAATVLTKSGLTTTGFATGDSGYISANNTVSKTDAAALSTSRFFGANAGTAGSMVVDGVLEMNFTTDGGSPSPGAPVYLALASADAATGAGKLTATPPSGAGEVVMEVGLVVDNSNYAGSKTSLVLLQPKSPVVLLAT